GVLQVLVRWVEGVVDAEVFGGGVQGAVDVQVLGYGDGSVEPGGPVVRAPSEDAEPVGCVPSDPDALSGVEPDDAEAAAGGVEVLAPHSARVVGVARDLPRDTGGVGDE